MTKYSLNIRLPDVLVAAALFLPLEAFAQDSISEQSWNFKSGADSFTTVKSPLIGVSQGQMYFHHQQEKVASLEDSDRERLAALLPRLPKAFTTDENAPAWRLSPDPEPAPFSSEFRRVPPGSFEIEGIRWGMTDREVFRILTEKGYDIEPVSISKSAVMGDRETAAKKAGGSGWLDPKERDFVTSKFSAVLHKNDQGERLDTRLNGVPSQSAEVRRLNIDFQEDLSVRPSRSIAWRVTLYVEFPSIADSVIIEKRLMESLIGKYGNPSSSGAWSKPYGNKGEQDELLTVQGTRISIINLQGEIRLSNNAETWATLNKEEAAKSLKKIDL